MRAKGKRDITIAASLICAFVIVDISILFLLYVREYFSNLGSSALIPNLFTICASCIAFVFGIFILSKFQLKMPSLRGLGFCVIFAASTFVLNCSANSIASESDQYFLQIVSKVDQEIYHRCNSYTDNLYASCYRADNYIFLTGSEIVRFKHGGCSDSNIRKRLHYNDMLPNHIGSFKSTPSKTYKSPYRGEFHVYMRRATSDYCAITYSANDNLLSQANYKIVDYLMELK